MKKTVLEIYALAVCFFAVACFVIALGLIIWNGIELSFPEFTINQRPYECHQTNERYKECFSSNQKYTRKENPEVFPTGESLTSARELSYSNIIKSEQRQALQGIVKKIIIILIDLLVFFIHWRLAKHSRENYS
ncbi:MAG: hypothetical protein GY820_19115 [Gammaproteobacteria bacterium]|nr:hypothetical protein [Gammaproteobacteria bacterium]